MTDFGRTASDYGRHRAGFPAPLFNRLVAIGAVKPGFRALDLGTGTGAVARSLAKRGLRVIGTDISAPMIDEARRLAAKDPADTLPEFLVAPAEKTGFGDATFDLITAGQCWHWFNRPRAASECRRMLKPGGAIVIAHMDWVAVDENAIAVTMDAIRDFGSRFPDALSLGEEGLYPKWTRDALDVGLRNIETFSFDLDISYSQVDWRGRVRASAAVGARFDPPDVERFDALLAERLRRFSDPLAVHHRIWAMVAWRPQQ